MAMPTPPVLGKEKGRRLEWRKGSNGWQGRGTGLAMAGGKERKERQRKGDERRQREGGEGRKGKWKEEGKEEEMIRGGEEGREVRKTEVRKGERKGQRAAKERACKNEPGVRSALYFRLIDCAAAVGRIISTGDMLIHE